MLLNVIKHQRPDIDEIFLYIKDPFEWKYQMLVNGREKVGIENLKCIQRHSLVVHEQLMMCMKSVNSVWWYDSRYGIW